MERKAALPSPLYLMTGGGLGVTVTSRPGSAVSLTVGVCGAQANNMDEMISRMRIDFAGDNFFNRMIGE
jgi:hypothetical protein